MNDSPEKLYQTIWGMFDILRGVTKNPDACFQIVSRLILLKWASDNYNTKHFEGNIPIKVPTESSWDYIQKSDENIQRVISEAIMALINENLWIHYSAHDESVLRVLEKQPELFKVLLDRISEISFNVDELPHPYILGEMFSEITKEISDSSQYSNTPADSVNKLLINIIKPNIGSKILDPFLSRGFLHQAAIDYIISKNGSVEDFRLSGQEQNVSALWAAYFVSLMYGIIPDYKLSDAFIEPNKNDNNELLKADFVVSMPPIGVRKWGREVAQYSNDVRFRYGLPSSNNGDIAAIEIALSHLKDKGKCGIITAPGVLFRSGSEAEIRKNIINADLIDSIISLPIGLLTGTAIPLVLIIFNKDKPIERKGKTLLLDYSELKLKRSGSRELPLEVSNEIIDIYENFKEKTGVAKIVSIDEIASKEYSLNISGYIEKTIELEKIEISEAIEKIQSLETERQEIVTNLIDHLKKFN